MQIPVAAERIAVCFLAIFTFTSILPCKTNEADQQPVVVKIIHQSWKNHQVPERFAKYKHSWRECYPDWEYMFWTDEDNRKLIETHYSWFLDIYDGLPFPITKADVTRYFYLFHFGGIYTDLDNECLKPFKHLLENYKIVFGAMKGAYKGTTTKEGYVQNSFMYSVPKHEFWLDVISEIMYLQKHPQGLHVEQITGPIVLTNMINELRDRRKDKNDYIKVYPPIYFNPYSWLYQQESDLHCKDYDRMSENEWKACRKSVVGKGSYVVQYHAHTWNRL